MSSLRCSGVAIVAHVVVGNATSQNADVQVLRLLRCWKHAFVAGWSLLWTPHTCDLLVRGTGMRRLSSDGPAPGIAVR